MVGVKEEVEGGREEMEGRRVEGRVLVEPINLVLLLCWRSGGLGERGEHGRRGRRAKTKYVHCTVLYTTLKRSIRVADPI